MPFMSHTTGVALTSLPMPMPTQSGAASVGAVALDILLELVDDQVSVSAVVAQPPINTSTRPCVTLVLVCLPVCPAKASAPRSCSCSRCIYRGAFVGRCMRSAWLPARQVTQHATAFAVLCARAFVVLCAHVYISALVDSDRPPAFPKALRFARPLRCLSSCLCISFRSSTTAIMLMCSLILRQLCVCVLALCRLCVCVPTLHPLCVCVLTLCPLYVCV